MTISASALPALAPNDEGRKVVERVNALIRFYNRPDLFVPSYGADSGSATAYATSQSTDIKVYEVGQIYVFKAANANTSTAPTLNVNALGAGTITYPDGSALVAGDIAANSFNSVIVTSTTPTFALLSAIGRSKLLQTVSTETGAVATGTTIIPFDDTIPQSGEGDQYMSLAITPKSATSTLLIDIVALFAVSALTNSTVSLLQDSTANALAAWPIVTSAGFNVLASVRHIMTSGTTSATTFKVRIGNNAGSTTTFNGNSGARLYGGVAASSIVIREVLP